LLGWVVRIIVGVLDNKPLVELAITFLFHLSFQLVFLPLLLVVVVVVVVNHWLKDNDKMNH